MPTYVDFNSTKVFRDNLIARTLQAPDGPQTLTSAVDDIKQKELPNVDPGDVTLERMNELSRTQSKNIYKPVDGFWVKEYLTDLPRRANLNIYPYFITNLSHGLINIMGGENYDTESELFKFSANYIRNDENGPVHARISQNLYSATIGRAHILDAINGNMDSLAQIIAGKQPLIDYNNEITVRRTVVGKAVDFMQTVAGVENFWTEIPGDYLDTPRNKVENAVENVKDKVVDTIGNLFGIDSLSNNGKRPSDMMLEYSGSGYKAALFKNLSYSKYSPNYDEHKSLVAKLFNFLSPDSKQYIGDDMGNNVKYAMNDNLGRPIKSPYYLSSLFDPTQATLFQKSKPITEGGPISGFLTWTSKNSRNKLGLYNEEYETQKTGLEPSLSTNFDFREGSILKVTQDLLNSMPKDSSARTHVANAIDQTSRVFKDGDIQISRGSALIYTDKKTHEESGIEYCRVWTKDRPYMSFSDTMKRTGLIRKGFKSSVMNKPWSVSVYPNEENILQGADGKFQAKKYMLSIENLAWKTSNRAEYTYDSLPACERGPNGGRVMWFPPYGLKVTEDSQAKWEENAFLGRPEPIYTYQNASRSAQLDFKIVVDHPSILNLLVREYFKGMNDEDADEYIKSFFGGCEELDFYDLINKYSDFTADDIDIIKAYLEGGKDQNTIKELRLKLLPSNVNVPVNSTPDNTTQTQAPSAEVKYTLFFDNDIPRPSTALSQYSDRDYSGYYETYINNKDAYIDKLNDAVLSIKNTPSNGWTDNKKKDYYNLTNEPFKVVPSTDKLDNMATNVSTTITDGFKSATEFFNGIKTQITNYKAQMESGEIKQINFEFDSLASSPSAKDYNLALSYRRSYSVLWYVFKELSKDGVLSDIVKNKLKWKNTVSAKDTAVTDISKSKNNINITFKELGYNKEGSVIVDFVKNVGEELNELIKTTATIGGKSGINCSKEFKDSVLKVTAPDTFFCRSTTITTTSTPADKKDDKPVDQAIKPNKIVLEEVVSQSKPKPTIDVLKKIIMKTLSECYYFDILKESSPLAFSSLKEKLKYFHPAFHATTPEGLNGRLTFLQQCLRPGDTIPVKGLSHDNDLNARNTSFGPPPIVVLRVGDFYNTKAVILNMNFTYDENIWDLNPEGIGVQPMIVSVNMRLNLFGGQGLAKPVDELQNALSFNFYGNTEVYDYRSTATEDRTDFNKATLQEMLDYRKDLIQQNISDVENQESKTIVGEYIGKHNNDTNTIEYKTILGELYTTATEYYEAYVGAYNMIVNAYGEKIASMILSPTYRTINEYSANNPTGIETINLLGSYKLGLDLNWLVNNFKDNMLAKVEPGSATNISELFKFNLKDSVESYSDDIIKPYLKTKLTEEINKLISTSIEHVENARNTLILILDKLNFITEVGYDGVVNKDNSTSGVTLNGLTTSSVYDEYKDVIDFIKDNYDTFIDDLDTSFDFTSNTLSDTDFKEFVGYFLTSEDIAKIIDLYEKTNSKNFDSKIRNRIENKLEDIIDTDSVKTVSVTDKIKLKENVTLSYEVTTPYTFTTDESNKLKKVNSTKANKPQDKLNYYR